MKAQHVLLLLICTLSACTNHIATRKDTLSNNYYTQGNTNRTAAEWEPARGTMIAWPLTIPYKLVIELAKDNRLFALVENQQARQDASKWFATWGIDTTQVTFGYAPQGIDASWVRDWGPSAVFMPDGKMKLGDGKYIYSTPVSGMGCNDSLTFLYTNERKQILRTDTEDQATVKIGKSLNMEVLSLPFVNTGGNVATDGQHTAFSSCILTNENRFDGTSDSSFFQQNKSLLGFSQYNILPNFEAKGIQHIDCFMKLLDEERILVARPPTNHPLYHRYEDIVNTELTKLRNTYGRPYQILRIDTYVFGNYKENLAAYTNSLILNKTIYVPLFSIPQDTIALRRWAEVMPGYTIKGFTFNLKDESNLTDQMKERYKIIGWTGGDALHCRTRAVWDSEMLYISTKRIEAEVAPKHRNIVYATVIDYSKKGLVKGKSQLFWRVKGEMDWKNLPLQQTDSPQHFFAEIPHHQQGATVEYYVVAESKSGKKETMPRTAPTGTYQFTIK